MTVDLQYIFVPKSQVWNEDHTILTWLLCVFWWRVPMPFAWCLWGFDILVLDSSKSRTPQLGTDRSWYRARSSGICWYTYIDEMLDIYFLSDWWSDEKSQRTHLKLYGNRMNVQAWCLSKIACTYHTSWSRLCTCVEDGWEKGNTPFMNLSLLYLDNMRTCLY